MKVAAFRKVTFNAAHRLYRKEWSDEKNREIFGLCANEHYHGHNYRLDVKVIGEIDPITGYVIDLRILTEIIQKEIIEHLDHKNLNLDVADFKDINPTGENIVVVIYNRLRKALDKRFELQVRLWETERNYFEYPV